MPEPRRPHASEEGPTLLFQRTPDAASERCVGCPFRHVPPDMKQLPRHTAAVLPVPPIHGPGAPPFHGPLPARPPAVSGPLSAALPRPARLALADRGSETLVLPDALKPAGPEAATVARPVHPGAAAAPRSTDRIDAARAGYDELASPDITVIQVATPAPRPAPRPRPLRPAPDARAYFVLNLCLGVLIVAGLAVLMTRELMPGSGPLSAGDHHEKR